MKTVEIYGVPFQCAKAVLVETFGGKFSIVFFDEAGNVVREDSDISDISGYRNDSGWDTQKLTEVEELAKENRVLSQQVTELQIALVDVYEMLI